MIFTEKEVANFIDCYLGNTDREFSGKEIEIGEITFGENKDGTDFFLTETQKTLVGKNIVLIGNDADGAIDMIVTDCNGNFYRYLQNKTGYNLTQIVPSVADFSD